MKSFSWASRGSAMLGFVVALGFIAGSWSPALASRAECVSGQCRPQGQSCLIGFRAQLFAARAECAGGAAVDRRACQRAAVRAYVQNKAQCAVAQKLCRACCTGSTTADCSAAVCGDGVTAGPEACDPPDVTTCDALCQVVVTTTTTSTTTTTTTTTVAVTTTTVTTSTTTTTTIPDAGVGVDISAPTNGTHFVAGEAPTVTVVLADDAQNPLTLSDLSTANLYMYGPQEQSLSTTAVGLLGASTDRNQQVHHYVNLKTNPSVVANGNVVSFPLNAITNELPGTYTVAVWAVRASDPLQQWMPLADCQIGTAVVETQTVGAEKCGSCHLGAVSGKYYMHHIDPGFSPTGNWALDSAPVTNCKACHNQAGYAAYNNRAGGSDANVNRTTDPIVRRVHGVHMGEELALPFNTDPTTGDFRHYAEVVFPADVRNCTSCHTDDRWNTNPSRQACATCHDTTWFGDAMATPPGYVNHSGLRQDNDDACFVCHGPGMLHDTAVKHEIPAIPLNAVDVSLTPPGNGSYYTAGDTPVVTVVIRNDAGNPIDHTVVNNTNFTTAALFVYGNRANTVPVLTNTARYGAGKLRASVQNGVNASGTPTAGWTFGPGDTFKLAVNGGAPIELTAPGGLQTPTQVKNWLAANLPTGPTGVTVSNTSTRVTIKSNVQGANSRIDIYNSPVTTTMVWKPAGVTMEPNPNVARASYPTNDLRALSDPLDYADPAVTRNTNNITYQLSDVAGLPAGTYAIYAWSQPGAGKVSGLSKIGIGFMTFQVGTATEEKKIATNCNNCHGETIMHISNHPAWFDTDYCKACHDYGHVNIGDAFATQGGTSQNGWSGFGAVPINRRIHGVHFGNYLEESDEIYAGGDPFSALIFPQDVRNCTKCHSETDDWITKPRRLACLGCHDSPEAKAHGKAMTSIPDPADPYGSSAVETCEICHGETGPWRASIVHRISDPFVPPYPRN